MLTSIVGISQRLRKRELSPVELTKDCLAKIEKLNPVLNAFITVTGDLALEQGKPKPKFSAATGAAPSTAFPSG
jgi:aspartyl-tRNA(Asn)/glutamyl-tRNA(Gln) amidotransferase subunit A